MEIETDKTESLQSFIQKVKRILLTHITGFIKLVKVMVRCTAQCTQLVIGHTSYRNIGTGVNPNIGIALWIVRTHI